MNYDIFQNEKEKLDAIKALPELEQHPGWKFITRTLDVNVKFLNDILREKKDFENLEQVYLLQDRIDDFEKLKDLPATIVEAAKDQPEEEESDDPYDQPEEDQPKA